MTGKIGLLSLLLVLTHGKPLTYDQRQEGNLNIHAKLDNIMIVIGIPEDKGPSSLFSDFVHLMELRGLSSRNKKVTVTDEEIQEPGKDPLNVRILRIESKDAEENVNSDSSIQTEEFQVEREEKSQSKALETSNLKHINIIANIKDTSFRSKEMPTIVEEKVSSKIPKEIAKPASISLIHKPESIESPRKDLTKIVNVTKLEKTPEKLIAYGNVTAVGKASEKVIYDSENMEKMEENGEQEIDNLEEASLDKNISQEFVKKEIAKLGKKGSEMTETQESISTENQEKQVLSRKLENQLTIVANGQRVARELRTLLNDPVYSKSRMSLKKELSRIDYLKKKDAGDKNEVHLIDSKFELKPIGEMIENCGPGRVRDLYGICQFDEHFN